MPPALNDASMPQDMMANLLGSDRQRVIETIGEGLEVAAFGRVAHALGMTGTRLSEILRIAPSTLARRKRAGWLSVEESERLYRLVFLIERSTQVLGGLGAARRWLDTDKRALGGMTPLDFATFEPGAREVEDLLGRIEYGIPS